jgi:hypothetical protein
LFGPKACSTTRQRFPNCLELKLHPYSLASTCSLLIGTPSCSVS